MDELTSTELSEWEAYFRLEPFGEERADFRTASLSSVLMNIVLKLYGKEGTKSVTPTEFMPEWDKDYEAADIEKPQPKQQSVEEMKEILYTIARVQNKNKPGRKKKK